MKGYVLDSGALVALERRTPRMFDFFEQVLRGEVEAVVPRTVIAQVWRGTSRQANVARLVSVGLHRRGPVIVDELTEQRAKDIGITIGRTSHPDIVDVHVAVAAAERGHGVLTSDDADIARIDPGLVIIHV